MHSITWLWLVNNNHAVYNCTGGDNSSSSRVRKQNTDNGDVTFLCMLCADGRCKLLCKTWPLPAANAD